MNDDNKKIDPVEIALVMLQLVSGGQQASADAASVQAAPKSLDLEGSVPIGRGKKGW